jgi:flagellin
MPLVINTNVSSLNSQRQLVNSGMELDQAMERLSSGKRVNNAADDAAGLAIANRMTSQIRGLNQSIRNANDGVSMIQTAEGALDETTNILQRMRELAIQAANGIYSDADRSTLDAEVQQLKAELDRIAESTTFNGQPILDGSLGNVTLQVGSEAADTIDLSISAMDTDTLGGGTGGDLVGSVMNTTASQFGDLISVATSASVSVNGVTLTDLTAVDNMNDLLNAFNQNVSGIETSAFVEVTGSTDGTGVLRGIDLILTVTDFESNTQTYTISETGSMAELVEEINIVTGGVVQASLDDNNRLQLSSDTAAAITASNTGGTAATDAAGLGTAAYRAQLSFDITDPTISDVRVDITGTAGTGVMAGANALNVAQAIGLTTRDNGDVTGAVIGTGAELIEGDLVLNDVALSGMAAGASDSQHALALVALINAKTDEHNVVASTTDSLDTAIRLNSVDGTEIMVDFAGTSATFDSLGILQTNNTNGAGDSVSGISIDTISGAQDALDVIDNALETINAIRADLGAVNNRLEFTMSNLANVVENTEASRSRIMDADFAAESAALSRAQVLQQASQAMLAQANARPQQVLQLLQG